jgi:hypothetical protein
VVGVESTQDRQVRNRDLEGVRGDQMPSENA